MEIVDLEQGTPEWHEHRRKYFNASDAPAMLGVSSYKTRAKLLHERKTGNFEEPSAATQAIFAAGHRAEALARPFVAEKIVGDDLFPAVGVLGEFSASFDGITDNFKILFEHKLLNSRLREAMPVANAENTSSSLPIEYKAQMEHQLLVAGAEKVLFCASARDGEMDRRWAWYKSDPEMRQRIISGWAAFKEDLEREDTEDVKPCAPTRQLETASLPSPVIDVTSEDNALHYSGNLLTEWEAKLHALIDTIPADPQDEADFDLCSDVAKALRKAEEELKKAFDTGLSHISGYVEIRNIVSSLCELARSARQACDTRVKDERAKIKERLVRNAGADLSEYCCWARDRCRDAGGDLYIDKPDFLGAITGLSSRDKIKDKIHSVLLEAKANIDLLENQVKKNLALLEEFSEYFFLFFDKERLAIEEDEKNFRKIVLERVNKYKKFMLERAKKQGPIAIPSYSTKERPALSQPASGLIGMKKLNTMLAPFIVNRYSLKDMGASFISMDRQPMLTPEQAQEFCDLCHKHIDYMAAMFAQNPDAIPELTVEELRDQANHWPFVKWLYSQEEDHEGTSEDEELEDASQEELVDEQEGDMEEDGDYEDEDAVFEDEKPESRKRASRSTRKGIKK